MKDWSKFIEDSIAEIRAETCGKQVLAALSGGVDSSVAAVLTHRAVGDDLTCIFVDNGMMRLDEGLEVERVFKGQFDMRLHCVDAEERFLNRLEGVSDPEIKRKIIGDEFIRVFEDEIPKISDNASCQTGEPQANCPSSRSSFLMQGTILTDIIESGGQGHAAIKSHHNVGGLPDTMKFAGLIEPLRKLYKHEVRELGDALGIPHALTRRQPFPGPGLGVRVIGGITKEKLDTLRAADAIFREEIENAKIESSQYFAIHTGLQSVGVKNGTRVFGQTIALRSINSQDFVSASPTRIPYETLERISERITNECPNVNRIVLDITKKPPGTIEWE